MQVKLRFICCFILITLMLSGSRYALACTGLSPNLSITSSGSCLPRNATFTNNSTGALAASTTYIWKVNGTAVDTTVGLASTTYPFTTPGTFTVRLVAITVGGCMDSSQSTHSVTAASVPRVEDGNGNASYAPVWQNCITLVNTPDSFVLTITPVNTLNSYTFVWGDGTSNSSGASLAPPATISHTYSALGNYTVAIRTLNGGCSDTIFGTVINNRIPTAGIIGPPAGQNSGCAPHTVRFINNSSNVSSSTYFRWRYGDGVTEIKYGANDTVYHTYPRGLGPAGCNITVRLEAINSCGTSQTTWNPVNIYDFDDARVTTADSTLCTPNQTFTLVNSSVNNCIPGTRYFYWDFGDGSTLGWISSRANQTKSYPVGTYPVMLVDSNACGRDTSYLNVIVNQVPTASFNFNKSSGCAPLTVNFGNSSTGLLNSYSWNFGDPSSGASNTSNLATPTHIYNNQGVFPVQLSVTNYCGNGSARDTIRAYGKPTVQMGNFSSGCAPLNTAFTNTTANTSTNATYFWDMGNGTTAFTRNAPLQTYATPGTYNIKLKVTDTCGTDSVIQVLRVFSLPTAKFGANRVCAGDTTRFSDSTSVVSGDTITSWLWNFADGNTSAQQNPKHVYNASGTYQVILRVTTQNGCIDYDTLNVIVDIAPIVSYNYSPTLICTGVPVTFNGTATTSSGTISSYNWSFGSFQTAVSEDTVCRFTTAGRYRVVFTAANSLGCSRTFSDSVTVYASPNAGFTSTPACRNSAVQFADTSTIATGASISTRQWDFDNNGTIDATGVTSTNTYSTAATFNVRLRVVSDAGCVDQDTQQVIVRPLPAMGLSVASNSVCLIDSAVFTNSTTGASQFTWNFGDGSSLLNTNSTGTQKKKYASTGSYTVKLVARTTFNCSDSATVALNIRPMPDAVYSTNDTIACAPKTFTFTNTSVNADTYRWLRDFTLTTHLTSTRPDTTLNVQGAFFRISLVAFNNFGCKPDTFTRLYRTLSNPFPNFTPSIDSTCGPAGISFSNGSFFATSYLWKFGNGVTSTATSPSTTFQSSATQDTTYKVWLIATNVAGCKDSISKNIRIFPRPVAAFAVNRLDSCGPFSVQFTNQSNHLSGGTINNMSFQWQFGNGNTTTTKDASQTFIASLTKDSVYQVRLIGMSRYGCYDTTTKNIKVYPKPRATFTQSRNDSCGPLQVTFTNTSIPYDTGSINIMTFNWSLGNGATSTNTHTNTNYIASLTQDTLYSVRLIAYSEHGCVDTTTSYVRIYPKPVAQFTTDVDNGCPPFAVNFSNGSTPLDTGNISIMTFQWNFGNGVTSTNQNDSVVFNASTFQDTTYTIKLKAFSEHGCVDSAFKTITVHPKPQVKFTPDFTTGCFPLTVNFTNQTINGSSYFWNFDDGNASFSVNSSNTFSTRPLYDTVYHVSLIGVSPFGCVGDTVTKPITVRYNPVPDFVFDPDTSCGNTLSRVFNTSLGAISYVWYLGNGTYTTVVNPFASYIASATQDTFYTAKLIAYSPYGCIDSIEKQIMIAPIPEADYAANKLSGCHPLTVDFTSSAKRAVRYHWDFGDGDTSTADNPSHTFINPTLNPVTYRVTQKVFSDNDCEDTVIRIVTVYPNPSANFTFQKIPSCDTAQIRFSNASFGAISYEWKFGDANTSNQTDPSHYFATNPTQDVNYTVKLISTSTFGCKDSIEKQVKVNPIVIASFTGTPRIGCKPHNVTFNNTSRNGLYYFWEFGDGGASIQKDPQHLYLLAATYSVKLIAIDQYNCADTLFIPNYIDVRPSPEAKFLANPAVQTLPNATVTFTDLSVSPTPLSYAWNFGDNIQSTLQNPVHTYTDSGTYVVTLKIDNGQCKDSTSSSVRINPLSPVADFDAAPPRGCAPHTVTFTNKSTNAYSFQWFFGDGGKSTAANPQHTYFFPGVYTVMLIATGPGGIDDTTKVDYIIVDEPPIANFSVNPKEVFLPDATVDLVSLSFNATQFQWFIKNKKGQIVWTDTNELARATLIDTGYFDVTLIVKSKIGCADTATQTKIISVSAEGEVYVPTAFTPDNNGLNDVFKPEYMGLQSDDYKFQIYNRWGELVFETTDRNAGWNGRFKDKPCEQDVYVWIIRGELVGNKKIILNGTVTLVR